jgi:hypothetical protein
MQSQRRSSACTNLDAGNVGAWRCCQENSSARGSIISASLVSFNICHSTVLAIGNNVLFYMQVWRRAEENCHHL